MTLAGSLRRWRMAGELRREAGLYKDAAADIPGLQLARLNQAWGESLALSPVARAMRERLGLPDRFADWPEFAAAVPVQSKADLRLDLAAAGAWGRAVRWRSTGGTTAQPVRFPVFGSEARDAGLDQWVGRARLGVTPADTLFMIWGHALMFGKGPRAALMRVTRKALDAAVGYTRWSAYRLSPEDLQEAGDSLLASRARYVVGYSCALDRFARANMDRAAEFRRLGLKAVIATAEGYPFADSAQVIEACLGAPAAMEYGSVETGPIAYQGASGDFDVFWARHRIEQGEQTGAGAALVVTCLNTRAMPLLRYAIGDAVSAEPGELARFGAVAGRVNDAVVLPGGRPIHSEAFTHVLRDLPGIRAFQIVTRTADVPKIRYEASADMPEDVREKLVMRLCKIDEALGDVALERVDKLALSSAGKHRMVVAEDQ